MKISVVIPVYNDASRLEKLLKSLKKQDYKKDFEIVVIDDHSTDNSLEIAKKYANKVLSNKENSGPAKSRNEGIKIAKGDVIAFTDSDCAVSKDWIYNIEKEMEDKNISALMGFVKIPRSSYIGDSISALGFPAGGSIGYGNMYDVFDNKYTNHISTCNCAVRKEVFLKEGLFDETYPTPGREDTEFAYRIWKKWYKIKYSKKVKVIHEARTDIKSLFKMNFARGRGTYHFKKKMPDAMKYFNKLRIKSTVRIIKKNILDFKIPMIFFLYFLSFIAQKMGYNYEKRIQEKSSIKLIERFKK